MARSRMSLKDLNACGLGKSWRSKWREAEPKSALKDVETTAAQGLRQELALIQEKILVLVEARDLGDVLRRCFLKETSGLSSLR